MGESCLPEGFVHNIEWQQFSAECNLTNCPFSLFLKTIWGEDLVEDSSHKMRGTDQIAKFYCTYSYVSGKNLQELSLWRFSMSILLRNWFLFGIQEWLGRFDKNIPTTLETAPVSFKILPPKNQKGTLPGGYCLCPRTTMEQKCFLIRNTAEPLWRRLT